MAEYKPQAVKDVPANDFIKAYAAHLKSTDKVRAGWPVQPSHTSCPPAAAAFWVPVRSCSSSGSSRVIAGSLRQGLGRGCGPGSISSRDSSRISLWVAVQPGSKCRGSPGSTRQLTSTCRCSCDQLTLLWLLPCIACVHARALVFGCVQLQIPDWVDIVKTATFKELPPQDKDWYYIRAGVTAAHRTQHASKQVQQQLSKRTGRQRQQQQQCGDTRRHRHL